jgi:hypothetical protein
MLTKREISTINTYMCMHFGSDWIDFQKAAQKMWSDQAIFRKRHPKTFKKALFFVVINFPKSIYNFNIDWFKFKHP